MDIFLIAAKTMVASLTWTQHAEQLLSKTRQGRGIVPPGEDELNLSGISQQSGETTVARRNSLFLSGWIKKMADHERDKNKEADEAEEKQHKEYKDVKR